MARENSSPSKIDQILDKILEQWVEAEDLFGEVVS